MSKRDCKRENRKRYYERFFDNVEYSPHEYVSYPGTMRYGWDEDGCGGLGYAVSTCPLYSVGYYDCNAVALVSPTLGALSHHNTKLGNGETHTCDLLKEFERRATLKETYAVLIGGERAHAEINRQVLNERKIPILGTYIDDFNVENQECLECKDVLVFPKQLEVIVRVCYSEDFQYNEDGKTFAYVSFKVGRKSRGFL